MAFLREGRKSRARSCASDSESASFRNSRARNRARCPPDETRRVSLDALRKRHHDVVACHHARVAATTPGSIATDGSSVYFTSPGEDPFYPQGTIVKIARPR